MQEKSRIKRNILLYLDKKGISSYDFYKKSGVTRGVLSQNNGISEDNLMRFLAFAPDVNVVWLLTGQGDMFHSPMSPSYVIEDTPIRVVRQEAMPYQVHPKKKVETTTDSESTPVSLALISQINIMIERTEALQERITTQAEEIGRLKAENDMLKEAYTNTQRNERGQSITDDYAVTA